MADDAGIGGVGVGSVENMYIASADAGCCYLYQYLGTCFKLWDFLFNYLQFTWL